MTVSDVLFAIVGFGALLASVLPHFAYGKPFSLPMLFLGSGLAMGALPVFPVNVAVAGELAFVEHFAEVVVIVSLMGAGLSLDRRVGIRRWQNAWRLLLVAMPLTILCVSLLGWMALGLTPAAAVLLGAVLAPTDPVLATEVQVGEPSSEPLDDEVAEEELRFSLSSEAGLNDALAFPFVYLAMKMAKGGQDWVLGWFTFDVLYRLAAGTVAGLLIGWFLSWFFFSVRLGRARMANHQEGMVAVAATFLAYGLTEVVGGYGFLAVFVAAVTIRSSERFHGYHLVLHGFVEQLERIAVVLALLLLGVAIADGMLRAIGWREVAFIAATLLLIRPVMAGVSLVRGSGSRWQRAGIAFFGVRGIGSLYYVAYGLTAAATWEQDRVLAVVGGVVAASVVLHGITAGPFIRRLDAARDARLAARGAYRLVPE